MATAKEKLTALANAVREKTNTSAPLTLDAMTAAIKALEAGVSLPEGFAMGQFNTTSDTMHGDFQIEHGLSAVPNVVVIFKEDPTVIGQSIRGVIRFNSEEEYSEDEGLYYPVYSLGRVVYDNTAGTNIGQAVDNGAGLDTDKTFTVPAYSTYVYMPHLTYRWIAVRLGE